MIERPYLHRKSIRLRGYDYSLPGGYFVTIVSYQRDLLFGEILDNSILLSECGEIVKSFWEKLPGTYPDIELGAFSIMPNHIHGVIFISDPNINILQDARAGLRPAPTTKYSVSDIVRVFKSFSSREINKLRKMPGVPVWQRNFYERIIRDDEELGLINEYIYKNVDNWATDGENIDLPNHFHPRKT